MRRPWQRENMCSPSVWIMRMASVRVSGRASTFVLAGERGRIQAILGMIPHRLQLACIGTLMQLLCECMGTHIEALAFPNAPLLRNPDPPFPCLPSTPLPLAAVLQGWREGGGERGDTSPCCVTPPRRWVSFMCSGAQYGSPTCSSCLGKACLGLRFHGGVQLGVGLLGTALSWR